MKYLTGILVIPVLTFIVSYSLCRFIIYFSHKKGLLDLPNEFRQHDTPTPYFGGIAIFIALSIGFIMFAFQTGSYIFIDYIILFLPFFLVGLIDDIFKLSSIPKLILIIIAALITSILFYGGLINCILIFLLLVFFTNSFNLLDNVDGLCASTGLAILIVLAIYNYNSFLFSVFLLITIFAITGFLILNIPKARIFMGDTGSLLIGAMCTIFVLDSCGLKINIRILKFLPLFWLPLYDTFSVIIVRTYEGRSVLIGGKDHFSHRLMKRGMSNLTVITVLFFITLTTGTVSLFSPPLFSLSLFIFIVATAASFELLTSKK